MSFGKSPITGYCLSPLYEFCLTVMLGIVVGIQLHN